MAGQLTINTNFECNRVTSVMLKTRWNPPAKHSWYECQSSFSTKVTAADLPITAIPPFLPPTDRQASSKQGQETRRSGLV